MAAAVTVVTIMPVTITLPVTTIIVIVTPAKAEHIHRLAMIMRSVIRTLVKRVVIMDGLTLDAHDTAIAALAVARDIVELILVTAKRHQLP